MRTLTDSRPCQRCTLPIHGELTMKGGRYEIWSDNLRVGISIPSGGYAHTTCIKGEHASYRLRP
jgi:hypothetical protein